jgi:DNA-binding NarL/FixJ family response regulator
VPDPIRVLIVDDDVPTRVGVRTILSSEPGIEVVGEAASGVQAIALAHSTSPHVVLMDVQLPDIDGIEATRHILDDADEEDTAPRVVILTTFAFEEYAYRALKAGASGFLLKRTPAEDLVDAVVTVAGGESLPAPEVMRSLITRFAPDASSGASSFSLALTPREQDVLVLIATGYSNQEIAERLHVSHETVKTHVKHVYAKVGARDRAQAVIAAYEAGLVDHPPGDGEQPS